MNDEISYVGLLDDDAITLDAAALQLARLDHPGLELEPYLAVLNTLTNRLAVLGEQADTAEKQAAMLSRVMAVEFRFQGDSTAMTRDNIAACFSAVSACSPRTASR